MGSEMCIRDRPQSLPWRTRKNFAAQRNLERPESLRIDGDAVGSKIPRQLQTLPRRSVSRSHRCWAQGLMALGPLTQAIDQFVRRTGGCKTKFHVFIVTLSDFYTTLINYLTDKTTLGTLQTRRMITFGQVRLLKKAPLEKCNDIVSIFFHLSNCWTFAIVCSRTNYPCEST